MNTHAPDPKDPFRLCRDMMPTSARTTHLSAHRESSRNENQVMTSLLPLGHPVSTRLDIATRERDSRMTQKTLSPLVECASDHWRAPVISERNAKMTQKPVSHLMECTSDQWRTNDDVMHEVRGGAGKPATANDRN